MKKKRARDAGKVRVAFRTSPRERERVVFQLGTSRPAMALKAAQLVQHDVAGIDLNMGCPKRFSVQDGMGVALLREGGKVACEILRKLRGGAWLLFRCCFVVVSLLLLLLLLLLSSSW